MGAIIINPNGFFVDFVKVTFTCFSSVIVAKGNCSAVKNK